MEFLTSIGEIGQALNVYLFNNADKLPSFTKDIVSKTAAIDSPIDRFYNTAEALYAANYMDDRNITDPGRIIIANIMNKLSAHGQYGINIDDRAFRIISAMRRDIPEPPPAGGWPAKEDDPRPLNKFLPLDFIAEINGENEVHIIEEDS